MRNVNMMYLRPGNMFRDFIIESKTEGLNSMGRPKRNYEGSGQNTLSGCLASASQGDVERFKQFEHPISHTIVQKGRPKAKAGDKLVCGEKSYLIHAVDDCGGLGLTTIYYAEERFDIK